MVPPFFAVFELFFFLFLFPEFCFSFSAGLIKKTEYWIKFFLFIYLFNFPFRLPKGEKAPRPGCVMSLLTAFPAHPQVGHGTAPKKMLNPALLMHPVPCSTKQTMVRLTMGLRSLVELSLLLLLLLLLSS